MDSLTNMFMGNTGGEMHNGNGHGHGHSHSNENSNGNNQSHIYTNNFDEFAEVLNTLLTQGSGAGIDFIFQTPQSDYRGNPHVEQNNQTDPSARRSFNPFLNFRRR
jgi:hypothetical protein